MAGRPERKRGRYAAMRKGGEKVGQSHQHSTIVVFETGYNHPRKLVMVSSPLNFVDVIQALGSSTMKIRVPKYICTIESNYSRIRRFEILYCCLDMRDVAGTVDLLYTKNRSKAKPVGNTL